MAWSPLKTAVLLRMGPWTGFPEHWGAPETQLGPARELAGVQPREGVFPPALPGGLGKSRAQSRSISSWLVGLALRKQQTVFSLLGVSG